VIGPVAYRLELLHQWKVHNAFHASLLIPYKEKKAQGPNYPGQIPDMVEGQEEWEVKKILDSCRRGRNKRLQYLLKWKGYLEAEKTWENKENEFAQELLEEFHKQYPKAIKSIRLQKDDSEIPTMTTIPHLCIRCFPPHHYDQPCPPPKKEPKKSGGRNEDGLTQPKLNKKPEGGCGRGRREQGKKLPLSGATQIRYRTSLWPTKSLARTPLNSCLKRQTRRMTAGSGAKKNVRGASKGTTASGVATPISDVLANAAAEYLRPMFFMLHSIAASLQESEDEDKAMSLGRKDSPNTLSA